MLNTSTYFFRNNKRRYLAIFCVCCVFSGSRFEHVCFCMCAAMLCLYVWLHVSYNQGICAAMKHVCNPVSGEGSPSTYCTWSEDHCSCHQRVHVHACMWRRCHQPFSPPEQQKSGHPWRQEGSFSEDDQSLLFDETLHFTAQWIIHWLHTCSFFVIDWPFQYEWKCWSFIKLTY